MRLTPIQLAVRFTTKLMRPVNGLRFFRVCSVLQFDVRLIRLGWAQSWLYRGGRRTGLALTDDLHMHAHACRWGVTADRPTFGLPVAERTAAVIWRILDTIPDYIFLWNVFPLHPHEPGESFSNRAHNSLERAAGEELLAELCTMLRPKRLVAIGNDAAKSLRRIANGAEVIQVRHPSYGGQSDFLKQVTSLYPCRMDSLL